MSNRSIRTVFCFSVFIATVTPLKAWEAAPQGELTDLGSLSDSFVALSHRVNPAVVEIFTTGYVAAEGLVSQKKLFAKQTRSGSGVVVDPNGYIITNAHVVIGATKVQVMFMAQGDKRGGRRSILKPQGELVGAQIVGLDRETDLAVLKVQRQNLSSIPLGDSDEVKQGQLVFAFGSPRGLENSVSTGVVSATARQLREEDPMIYIQTPEDNLIPQLGILVIELDRRVRTLLPGLRSRDGVVVAARSVESPPIETLGFLPGDVIFAVNQTLIENLSDLREAAANLQKGDTVVFHLERQRELVYVPVEIQ